MDQTVDIIIDNKESKKNSDVLLKKPSHHVVDGKTLSKVREAREEQGIRKLNDLASVVEHSSATKKAEEVIEAISRDPFSDKSKKKIKLGDYLVKNGLVAKTAVDVALKEQEVSGEHIGSILVRNGFINQDQLVSAIIDINPVALVSEHAFSGRVSPKVLLEYDIVINAETEKGLYVSCLCPEIRAREVLEAAFEEKTITFMPFNPSKLESYQQKLAAISDDDEGVGVDSLLRIALVKNISDIHIIPRHSSYTILFRYMGVRQHYHEGDMEEYNRLVARIKDRARMDLAERRIPQDGAFQVEHNGRFIDNRVATIPTANGESIIIRLLDPDRVQPSLTALGISRVDLWEMGVKRPDGLCLICGPTGSGKTTTLNATIKALDRFGQAIYSIEDPVEYRIEFTGQVNVNPTVGLDFSKGIRAFMRSDPDVIVLGEIRDEDTARNAIKAAETGHLVLGTLHTGSIFGAVERMKDIGIEPREMLYLVRSIMVQRLIRVVCSECGGSGCGACLDSGYSGRTVVSECAYFRDEEDVARLLDNEVTWKSMVEDAVGKVVEGVTDEKEIIRVFGSEGEYYLEKAREK